MPHTRRTRTKRWAALAAALLATALAPAETSASGPALTSTLRDGKTGFVVQAPAGFKLSQHAGVYTIAKGKLKLIYARAKTSQAASQAGDAIARAQQASVGKRRASDRSFRATLTTRKGTRVLELKRSGSYLRIATYASGRGHASAAAPQAHAALTADDIALLRRISQTANGGRPIALGGGVRLKPFTAQDGSATAFVPDRRGWQYDGLRGVIEGANPNEGAFAFGVVFYVQTPATFILLRDPRFPQAPGFLDAAGSLTIALPEWFSTCCRAQMTNVQITGQLPGSEQFLGPGYSSGFFTATFTLNGRPWQGVFLLGSNPTTGVDGTFYVYYSYAAVPVGTPPAIGAALLQTWASWNPSADQARRRNETLATILSTHFTGGPIDQAVFDEAAAKWDAYIQE